MIDIGLNLASKRLYHQAAALLERARQVGLSAVIVTGSDEDSNRKGAQLARQFPNLYFTVGHHPHHGDSWSNASAQLQRSLAVDEHCVAIGEMGLDYFRNCSSPVSQRRCFEQQLRVAVDLQKPVFLHERQAYGDFRAMLLEVLPQLSGAVWHCFTGSREQMEEMASHGLYFGITGWLCDPQRGAELREVVRHIPAERLMIETDAPYLTPKTLKPTPHCNEPAFLPEVLRVLAQCRGGDYGQLAALTRANTERFFNLP